MANGIEWFRWHHGSVTDPKFQLVAKRSGARLGDVLAVWAYVLEEASTASERGKFGTIDCESMDCLLQCEEGTTKAILEAMESRKLTECGSICNWHKRQPKRERDDDLSTDRVRAMRERKRNETPCNANETAETPREEESREDINLKPSCPQPPADDAIPTAEVKPFPDCPHDQILSLYASLLPSLPVPRVWSAARRKLLQSRWRWCLTAKTPDGRRYASDTASGIDFFRRFFELVSASDFLTGRNGKWTGCDLEWLLRESKFIRVLEGAYDQPEKANVA